MLFRSRIAPLAASVAEIDFDPMFEVARLLYEGPWVAERYAVVKSLIESQRPAIAAILQEYGVPVVDESYSQRRP